MQAASDVLKGLEEMNNLLEKQKYLVGDSVTEVDLKNFAWVTRHDYAYSVIFKSPGGRIAQYKSIASYVKRLVEKYPKLLDSVDMPDACGSYYRQVIASAIVTTSCNVFSDRVNAHICLPAAFHAEFWSCGALHSKRS